MRKIIMFILLIATLIIIFIFVAKQFAGQFLVVDQQPRSADAIIVLSGPPDELNQRMEHAYFLYGLHYAPYLIFSGNRSICNNMRDYTLNKGIPIEAIILEDNSYSTYDNAVFTRNVMISHGFKSAIIVSSDYHMRRVKFLFDNLYKGTGINLIYSASKSSFFNPQIWWGNNKSVVTIAYEYCKLLSNYFGIHCDCPRKLTDNNALPLAAIIA